MWVCDGSSRSSSAFQKIYFIRSSVGWRGRRVKSFSPTTMANNNRTLIILDLIARIVLLFSLSSGKTFCPIKIVSSNFVFLLSFCCRLHRQMVNGDLPATVVQKLIFGNLFQSESQKFTQHILIKSLLFLEATPMQPFLSATSSNQCLNRKLSTKCFVALLWKLNLSDGVKIYLMTPNDVYRCTWQQGRSFLFALIVG